MGNLSDITKELNNEDNAIVYGNFLDETYLKFKRNELDISTWYTEPFFNSDLEFKHQAYFAAVIHKLSNDLGFETPKWVLDGKYVLDKPYFAVEAKGMLKALLLFESPREFRTKNIYVSANAMTRV